MFDKSNSKCCMVASMLLLLMLCSSTIGKIIYVDNDAAGANDGSSWENAYVYLQDALADANSAEKPVEIRVAQGVYKPDQGADVVRGDKSAAFQLINGVAVCGGFAGIGAIEPDARSIETYVTILSGDLAGDDAEIDNPDESFGHPTRAENSNAVIRGDETDQTAMLDGVTITAGSTGMGNRDGSPSVNNCTFANAETGIFNLDSSQRLTNCTFKGLWGDAIYQFRDSLTLISCTFTNNTGGAINCNLQAELTLQGCTFINNDLSLPIISCFKQKNLRMYNCVFRSNVIDFIAGVRVRVDEEFVADNCIFAGNVGLPILLHGGPMVISNCVFTGNIGDFHGSGIYSESPDTIIRNCTFSGNSSRIGDSVLSLEEGGQVSNCIFWDNIQSAIDSRHGEPFVRYCDVQGEWPGEGNIDVDPFFVMPGYWDQNGTLDDTTDDFWVDGDYHLKSQAGRWDPVSESWIVDDVTSLCIDAGDPNSPVAFEPFPNGGIINMGAYGGSSQAGKSPSGIHAKYGGGTGKPNDPYLIYTAEQMNTIGAEPNNWNRHFKLMADIDLKDFGESPFNLIGSYSHPFKGVFDGNGHTISNLTYAVTGNEEPDEDGYIARFGLFRSVDDPNAVIRDLSLVNPDIRPASTCGKRMFIVGALVGYLRSGSVSNCRVEGGQVQGEHGIGGLTGSNWGTISDCYTTCKVGPAEQRSLANVDEPFDRREFFGGLVGVNYREISNCHAVGEVSGEWTVGGLVGEAYGRISNSWSGGDVSGDHSIGGLIGMTRRSAQISHCYATGYVSGQRSVGGLVGYSLKDSSINSCYVTGCVSAEQEAGGLVGLHEGSLSECCSSAPVSVISDTAGGLVGFNGGKIFTSWACGDVTSGSNIGGLVGENRKWSQLIAGILFEYDGIVVDSYAKGSVYGEDGIGGLVGDNSGTVLGSYSTGRVTGERNFGGLVGINSDIPVLGSFWDTETSGLDTSSGGIGKTTAEMQTACTFLEAGWDFVNETENGTEDIWWILEGQDYPRLWWELID